MSDENLPETPEEIEAFISDPKNAKQVGLVKGMFNYFLAEAATKEQEQRDIENAKKKPKGVLDILFPSKKDDE